VSFSDSPRAIGCGLADNPAPLGSLDEPARVTNPLLSEVVIDSGGIPRHAPFGVDVEVQAMHLQVVYFAAGGAVHEVTMRVLREPFRQPPFKSLVEPAYQG